jgi:hypothetical protein
MKRKGKPIMRELLLAIMISASIIAAALIIA